MITIDVFVLMTLYFCCVTHAFVTVMVWPEKVCIWKVEKVLIVEGQKSYRRVYLRSVYELEEPLPWLDPGWGMSWDLEAPTLVLVGTDLGSELKE
jgi:hypothetical protein